MDEYLETILKKIDTQREKNPKLMNMWTHYFAIKKKIFLDSLTKCEEMIEEIENMPDFDEKTILLIYILIKYKIINV